jgi:hypothetical protein
MMRKPIIVLILLILLSSCSKDNETLPGINIPLNEMNRHVELDTLQIGGRSIKNNKPFILDLKNISDQVIIFAGDYGVKLFIKKGEEWVEVENRMHYPENEVLLPLASKFPPGRDTGIVPYIPELKQPIMLRVVVVGYPENNPNKIVGSYIDLSLNP